MRGISWTLLVTAAAFLGCSDQGSSSSPTRDVKAEAAKAEWEARQAVAQQEETKRCTAEKTSVLASFEEAMRGKEYNKAHLLVYRCSVRTADPDYLSRASAAQAKLDEDEVRGLVKKLTAKNAPISDSLHAYEKLLEFKGKPAFKLAEPHVARYAKQYEEDKRLDQDFRRYDTVPQIGWSESELIAKKGYPSEKNRTVTSAGVSEQWVYCWVDPSDCVYVYVRDGVVTAYQD